MLIGSHHAVSRTQHAAIAAQRPDLVTPLRSGAGVEAVVALGPTGKEMEIGRFAVFPSEPFVAASPRELRAYRFDASAALAAFKDQPLLVQLRLVQTDEAISPEGAKLTLSRVEITARPAN